MRIFRHLVLASSLLLIGCDRDPSRPARPSSLEKAPSNTTNQSLRKAKKYLTSIYANHRTTLYCGCNFDARKNVDRSSCGYVPARENNRARRVEWEHVVPASMFGRTLSAWTSGHSDCVGRKGKRFKGRHCARKVSTPFRYMEADMYNMYPVVGELNERRDSFAMGVIAGEARSFGQCDFEVVDGKVEPPPHARGDIARTYYYMDSAYPGLGILTAEDRELFERWNQADPVDKWECERARRIADAQGNVNAVVESACRALGL